MYIDKTKSKFAIIQVQHYKTSNITGVVEVIYDKKTKEMIDVRRAGCYPGKPRTEATWRSYKLMLDVYGKNPDVEYFTEEQYKACWEPNSICDVRVKHIWVDNFRKYLVYEQEHYKHAN